MHSEIPVIPYHQIFDLLAVCVALAAGILTYRLSLKNDLEKTILKLNPAYFLFYVGGTVLGGYGIGTLNMWLSSETGIGRSIIGALTGAIISIEIYKKIKGIKGSTGYMYVIPFSLCVAIGRIGCFLTGLSDYTYGTPTHLPFGYDFGDGIPRHPVQLYESFSMLLFALICIVLLTYRKDFYVRYGFYLCAGYYGAQRFLWEFLKPYADIFGPLNIFQINCLCLILYSFYMLIRTRDDYRAA